MNRQRFRTTHLLPLAIATLGGFAALAAAMFWPSGNSVSTAHAQGVSCSNTVGSAAAENQQAFVDLGEGNLATFVCIESAAFPGGQSQPVMANGAAGDGCYFVEGLGTWLVAVYRESPDVKQCPDLVRITVGTASQAAPTPTPTQPPQPTPTATQPPATATQPPSTPQMPASPTQPPASPTARPTMVMPMPPASGSGLLQDESGSEPLFLLAAAAVAFAVGTGGILVANRKRSNASNR